MSVYSDSVLFDGNLIAGRNTFTIDVPFRVTRVEMSIAGSIDSDDAVTSLYRLSNLSFLDQPSVWFVFNNGVGGGSGALYSGISLMSYKFNNPRVIRGTQSFSFDYDTGNTLTSPSLAIQFQFFN